MTEEELETREKLKLMNIAKDWLRTEHSEGNVQSLVNLILSFTEPKDRQIAELKDYRLTTVAKQQTDMSKYALNLEHKLSWYDDQLSKAKEIIKNLVEFDSSYKDDEEYQRKSELYDKMWEEAEQFIKDSEVEK